MCMCLQNCLWLYEAVMTLCPCDSLEHRCYDVSGVCPCVLATSCAADDGVLV